MHAELDIVLPILSLSFSLSLSLSRFNGHFPREPGLTGVIETKDNGSCGPGAISRAKLHSNRHHHQTNIQFFTAFLSLSQQCQSNEGENITFHGLGLNLLRDELSLQYEYCDF